MAIGSEYIGSYRLLGMLRQGSTCQVWEVLDSQGKRVALKALMEEFAKSSSHVKALKAEYEIGSSLDHPRVVRSFDFGKTRQIAYMTMELFRAPNLKQFLQAVSLNPGADPVDHLFPGIVDQASEGLAYLHSQGWIHRDVKPHNFLVSDEGETKLIDFSLTERAKSGLGKLFSGRSKIQGTRSYMSPEQIRGKPLDPRADIYSFGCTIHELFSGKPPYTGITADDLLSRHLKAAPPSLEASNKNITSEFAELVRRCLAKTPEGRPASMDDFLKEYRKLRVYRVQPKVPEKKKA